MVHLYYDEDTNDKLEQLLKVSNPKIVIENATRYFNKPVKIYVSPLKTKKYMVLNPNTNKFVSFGHIKYQDYTKHLDQTRLNNYLRRATNIKGDWKNDMYSPNNLSINLLWSN